MTMISRALLVSRNPTRSAAATAVRRFTTVNVTTASAKPRGYGSSYLRVLATSLGLGVAATSALFYNISSIRSDPSSLVQVSPKVDDFPTKIASPLLTQYSLIAHGIREVSFLRMQVYALGVYISDDDVPQLSRVFHSKFLESFYEEISPCEGNLEQHRTNLRNALNDPQVSNILVKNLLNSGVKFCARICAIRNTDLSHLRDGFIRTIRNNPTYSKLVVSKDADSAVADRIIAGLDDLRDVFNSYKTNAKKNSVVYMEMEDNGSLRVSVEVVKGDKTRDEAKVIGVVHEPLIAQLLFESYLGAEKPLVKKVQTLAADSLAGLVE